ncbi:glycerol-3-phosphate cytidylyltransferase [Bacillus sp. SORGH_AS 510]|nr:glycerol-3-phosphate cytidylyltransferase [Bacillus sp. SORGH_AS_0510]
MICFIMLMSFRDCYHITKKKITAQGLFHCFCALNEAKGITSNMKKVITYGTFDLLHYGHINLLKRAKELGDYLIVALSTNEFNEVKGKKCYFSFDERKKLLESIRYVDLVIPENNWEQKVQDIEEFKVDIFVMGDDWKNKFDYLNDYCDVVYLGRTPEISTTKIKHELGLNKV